MLGWGSILRVGNLEIQPDEKAKAVTKYGVLSWSDFRPKLYMSERPLSEGDGKVTYMS